MIKTYKTGDDSLFYTFFHISHTPYLSDSKTNTEFAVLF